MSDDTSDDLFTEARRLPTKCPTCGSENPTTYYGSCFDNQHSTIFDPRLPLDPWHAYMNDLRLLRRDVDNLNAYVKAGREVLERAAAERDADVSAGAVARTVAMSHIAAERDVERAGRERAEAEARQLREAIGDPDELRWHRWHCEETGQGDDLRELLVRIADAADAADVAVAEGAEDRGQTDG